MAERRSIDEIMVRNLVSLSLDAHHEFGVTQRAVTDEKKCSLCVVVPENFEHLRSKHRMRTVVE